jgi:transposase
MPVKSDRNDARKIAQLMRLGWFRPVHCKSITAQEIRAMLTARKLVQSKLLDLENSLRGILQRRCKTRSVSWIRSFRVSQSV